MLASLIDSTQNRSVKFNWFHSVPFGLDYTCAFSFSGRSLFTSTCQFLRQIIHFWPTAALCCVMPDILTVVLLKMQVSQDVTISSWTACPLSWRHYDPQSPQELFSSQHILTTHKTLYMYSLNNLAQKGLTPTSPSRYRPHYQNLHSNYWVRQVPHSGRQKWCHPPSSAKIQISGATLLLPHTPSWCRQGQLHIF